MTMLDKNRDTARRLTASEGVFGSDKQETLEHVE
jgi:hypothetical protein